MPAKRKSTKKAPAETFAETSKKVEGELTAAELTRVAGGAAVGGTAASMPTKIVIPEGDPNRPIIIGSVYNG